jgi:NAD-dependent dihydropyrimidine dehydrogenase PreA subunit
MLEQLLPTIDLSLCTGCGLCVERCPTGAVELVDRRPVIVRPLDCAYCGLCEEMCPVEAIALAYEITIQPTGVPSETTDRQD